jgi:hypothetical protein
MQWTNQIKGGPDLQSILLIAANPYGIRRNYGLLKLW